MKIADPFLEVSRSLTEAQLKRQIEDYLDLKGILYLRLNAGDRIIIDGHKRYRIKGVVRGCADLLVLVHDRAIFLELKTVKGKQRPEQVEFEGKVKGLLHEYYVVRSLEDLIEILEVT